MRRRRVEPQVEDEVIDLRDRLAPYDDATFSPAVPRPRATEEAPPEPALWKPLEFDFD